MSSIEYFRTRLPLIAALMNAESCKRFAHFVPGTSFNFLAFWANAEKFCWLVSAEELEKNFHGLMKNSPTDIQRFCRAVDLDLEKQSSFVQEFLEKDFSSEPLPALKQILLKNLELCYPVIGKLVFPIDAFDFFSEKHIKRTLSRKLGSRVNEKGLEKLFAQISAPNYTSYVITEENDFWTAAFEIQQKKPDPQIIKKKAIQLFEKYWWAELGWERQSIQSKEFFEQKLIQLAGKSPEEMRQKMDLIANSVSESNQKRNAILREHGLQELEPILKLTDQLARYHDVRKEAQMKSNWLTLRLTQAISQRTGIPTHLLDNTTLRRLVALCDGKEARLNEWQEYAEAYYYEFNAPNELLLSGKKALEKIASISSTPENVGNFGGTIACNGVVTGKAKICFGSQDALKKIQPGDILVAGMTTPDFVPAMRKAAAIVTDDGGITCHAAIISRELGIPCIVGTQIGTKLLKDNDWIEVDANHGVVRRLGGAD